MPQSTGVKYAAADRQLAANNVSWVSPQNAREADEPDETTFTSATLTASQQADVRAYRNFALLAEDGGTIPAGATITSVLVEFRFQVSLSTGGLDNVTGTEHGRVYLDGVQLLNAAEGEQTVLSNTTVRTTTSWQTRTLTWAGTLSAPQTTFDRADLAHGVGGTGLEPAIYGFEHAGGGAIGTATLRCAWVRVTAEWALVHEETGEVISTGVAQGARRVEANLSGRVVEAEAPGAAKTHTHTETGRVVEGKVLLHEDIEHTFDKTSVLTEGADVEEVLVVRFDKTGRAIEGQDAHGSVVGEANVIDGLTLNSAGTPLGSCVVNLFETPSQLYVACAISDASGVYSFARRSDSGEHFLRAYKHAPAVATNVMGTTDDDLVVAATQFRG